MARGLVPPPLSGAPASRWWRGHPPTTRSSARDLVPLCAAKCHYRPPGPAPRAVFGTVFTVRLAPLSASSQKSPSVDSTSCSMKCRHGRQRLVLGRVLDALQPGSALERIAAVRGVRAGRCPALAASAARKSAGPGVGSGRWRRAGPAMCRYVPLSTTIGRLVPPRAGGSSSTSCSSRPARLAKRAVSSHAGSTHSAIERLWPLDARSMV